MFYCMTWADRIHLTILFSGEGDSFGIIVLIDFDQIIYSLLY